MKSAPKRVPFGKADAFASQLEARDLDPGADTAGRKGRGFDILLRLGEEDLERLERQARAMRCTRNKWVAALLHKALHGKAPLNPADRGGLAAVVKDLRKIEAGAAAQARALAHLEETAQALLARLGEVERFRAQVSGMADALDEVFHGHDAYWRNLLDKTGDDSAPSNEHEAGRSPSKGDVQCQLAAKRRTW